jgi:histidinol phosphatase-like PHP family hydrolase
MKEYRADLHIHTVLSPCGDLEMSPENILAAARNKNIDILGITDHNHTGMPCSSGNGRGIPDPGSSPEQR